MDPLTTSTALATVVGLICNFRQENGAKEALNHQKFIEWLEYHRHDDIKDLITNTYNLQDEVNRLLRADHSEIIAKLNTINDALTSVLSHISDFSFFWRNALDRPVSSRTKLFSFSSNLQTREQVGLFTCKLALTLSLE